MGQVAPVDGARPGSYKHLARKPGSCHGARTRPNPLGLFQAVVTYRRPGRRGGFRRRR